MSEERKMSADELASELYARQGYYLIAIDIPLDYGFIVRSVDPETGDPQMPLRVVEKAIKTKFLEQRKMAEDISGLLFRDPCGPYFYRVEAMD